MTSCSTAKAERRNDLPSIRASVLALFISPHNPFPGLLPTRVCCLSCDSGLLRGCAVIRDHIVCVRGTTYLTVFMLSRMWSRTVRTFAARLPTRAWAKASMTAISKKNEANSRPWSCRHTLTTLISSILPLLCTWAMWFRNVGLCLGLGLVEIETVIVTILGLPSSGYEIDRVPVDLHSNGHILLARRVASSGYGMVKC